MSVRHARMLLFADDFLHAFAGYAVLPLLDTLPLSFFDIIDLLMIAVDDAVMSANAVRLIKCL